jgi:hypothetical protein
MFLILINIIVKIQKLRLMQRAMKIELFGTIEIWTQAYGEGLRALTKIDLASI